MPQIDGFADDVAEMTRAERDELEDRLFAVLSAVYAVRSALAASDVEAAHSAAAQAILQLSDILQELSDG